MMAGMIKYNYIYSGGKKVFWVAFESTYGFIGFIWDDDPNNLRQLSEHAMQLLLEILTVESEGE